MPKVSVIVPVYNTEKFVGLCINSILNQSFRDFELLLIDDGSSDKSAIICENYARIDKRVQVIKKCNEGVSATRNLGIDLAKGEYIQFIDSDDCIHADMLKRLVSSMEAYDADIAFCGMKIVEIRDTNNMNFINLTSEALGKECVYDKKKFIQSMTELFWETSIMEGPCNRIYRACVLRLCGAKFPLDMSYGEDCVFNLKYYANVKTAVFLEDIMYYYIWYNTQSLARSYKEQLFYNQMIQVEMLLACVEENGKLTKRGEECWANYCAYQSIKCMRMIACESSNLSEVEKKRAINHIVQHKLVRRAFKKAPAIAPEHFPIKEYLLLFDVGKLFCFLVELCIKEEQAKANLNNTKILDEAKKAVINKQSFLNRAFCKACRGLQRVFKKGAINKWAQIVELNLKTVGLKTTFKRVAGKIFKWK